MGHCPLHAASVLAASRHFLSWLLTEDKGIPQELGSILTVNLSLQCPEQAAPGSSQETSLKKKEELLSKHKAQGGQFLRNGTKVDLWPPAEGGGDRGRSWAGQEPPVRLSLHSCLSGGCHQPKDPRTRMTQPPACMLPLPRLSASTLAKLPFPQGPSCFIVGNGGPRGQETHPKLLSKDGPRLT